MLECLILGDSIAVGTKLVQEYYDSIIVTKYVQPDHIHPSQKGYKDIVKKAGL